MPDTSRYTLEAYRYMQETSSSTLKLPDTSKRPPVYTLEASRKSPSGVLVLVPWRTAVG